VKRDATQRTLAEGILRRVEMKGSLHLENGVTCSSLVAINCSWRKYQVKEKAN